MLSNIEENEKIVVLSREEHSIDHRTFDTKKKLWSNLFLYFLMKWGETLPGITQQLQMLVMDRCFVEQFRRIQIFQMDWEWLEF